MNSYLISQSQSSSRQRLPLVSSDSRKDVLESAESAQAWQIQRGDATALFVANVFVECGLHVAPVLLDFGRICRACKLPRCRRRKEDALSRRHISTAHDRHMNSVWRGRYR